MNLSSTRGYPTNQQEHVEQNTLQLASLPDRSLLFSGDLNSRAVIAYNPTNSTKDLLEGINDQFSKFREQTSVTLKANTGELALKEVKIVALQEQLDEKERAHQKEMEAVQKMMQTLREELEREKTEKKGAQEALSETQLTLKGVRTVNSEVNAKNIEVNLLRERETADSQRGMQSLEGSLNRKVFELRVSQEAHLRTQVILNNTQREFNDFRALTQESNIAHQGEINAIQRRVQTLEEDLGVNRRELGEAQVALNNKQGEVDAKQVALNNSQAALKNAQASAANLQVQLNAANAATNAANQAIANYRNSMQVIRNACGSAIKVIPAKKGLPQRTKVKPAAATLYYTCNNHLTQFGI